MPDPDKQETNASATPATPPEKPSTDASPSTIVDNGKTESGTSLGLSAAIDKIAADKVAAQNKPAGDTKEKAPPKAAPKEKKDEVKEPEKKPQEKKDDETDGEVSVKDPMGKAKREEAKKEEEEVPETEIEEELKTPHKNIKSAQRYRSLYNRWKKAESEVAKTKTAQKEKDEKLAALEKEMAEIKAGKGATDAEIEKEREELLAYRRRDELDSDPRIKETYDNRIKAADDSIIAVLQKYNVKPEAIKAIQENGGFEAYLRENGEDAKKFLDAIQLADSESIRSALTEKSLIKRAKGEFIKSESAKAKEYFANKKKQEEEAKKNAPNPAAEEEKNQEVLGRWTDNAYKQLEYFHVKEVPDDATAEEKKQIEADNAKATELRGLLKASLKPTTLQERVDVALAATLARRAVDQLSSANERIAALEAELKELKEADETTPKRGGSITSGNTDTGKKKTAPKSLGEALDRIEAGETVV